MIELLALWGVTQAAGFVLKPNSEKLRLICAVQF